MKKNYLVLVLLLSMTTFLAKGQWTIYNGSMIPDEHPIEFDVSNSESLTDQEFADLHSTSDGILRFLLDPDFVTYPDGQRAMWRHQFDTDVDSATFIVKIRGLSDTLDWVLDLDLQLGGYREQVQIQTDNTINFNRGDAGEVALPAGFSTQDWHTYRITFNAADSTTSVYLDGVDTAYATSVTDVTTGNTYFRFVSGDRNKSIGFEMDYLVWDITDDYSTTEKANAMNTPAGYNIAFVEADGREPVQIDFLEQQGFNVDVLEATALTAADQAYFDALNLADLVIIGRSPNSGLYRGADATMWKDSITSPVILNAQYVAQNGAERINWFETGSAYHANNEPEVAYAQVSDPNDTIFSYVTVGDSIPWMYAPHDLLRLSDTATNGTIAANYRGLDALIVQNDPGELYDGGPSAMGSRTYFGFGNDNDGYDNFFPLTDEAQQVYFNEISRLLRIGASEVDPVVWTMRPPVVALVQDADRDDRQLEFLEANGYDVWKLNTVPLATASAGFIDSLNMADLVIIGRSPNSGQYRGADATAWKDSVTSPVVLNAQYIAQNGPERINWFETGSAYHANEDPEVAYAQVADPNDTIFSFVSVGDSIPWMYAPHDLLRLSDTATNGTMQATFRGLDALIVQNEGGSPLYEGGPTPQGPRTYFGFGNDDGGWDNFFPLTPEAQQVYFNELQRLIGRPMKEVVTVSETIEPATIAFIESDGREPDQIGFLEANEYNVMVMPAVALTAATQGYIDSLNMADLVIIGRSPNSGLYRGDDATMWKDSITSPVIANGQYVLQNGAERMNWFETGSAYHANEEPAVAYGRIADPEADIFSFVDIPEGDSIPWMNAPHDLLRLSDTATYGNYAVSFRGLDALVVQMEADSMLYEGGPTPVGPRTYFGFGNDDGGWDNFFPLTDEAQQVYYNEIQRLLGREMQEVVTVEPSQEPEPEVFTVSVVADPTDGGSVSGGGDYDADTDATVEATANDGYEFTEWTVDGSQVSTDASYTFTVTGDVTVTAVFTEIVNPNVEGVSANALVKLYPNPATSTITVEGIEQTATISVLNAVGQLVTSYNDVVTGDQLDVSSLENGLYILRVESNGEVVDNVRFIKQ